MSIERMSCRFGKREVLEAGQFGDEANRTLARQVRGQGSCRGAVPRDEIEGGRTPVAAHGGVRLADEVLYTTRQPVIAPRHAVPLVHSLLDNGPGASAIEEEGVVVDLVTVLNGGAIDLGRRAACRDERIGTAARPLAPGGDLVRRAPGGGALPAGDEEPQSLFAAPETFLDRSARRRRESAGVPIEAEDATERLEPVRIAEAPEEAVRSLLENDELGHLCCELGHSHEQPTRRVSGVQRKIGGPGAHVLSLPIGRATHDRGRYRRGRRAAQRMLRCRRGAGPPDPAERRVKESECPRPRRPARPLQVVVLSSASSARSAVGARGDPRVAASSASSRLPRSPCRPFAGTRYSNGSPQRTRSGAEEETRHRRLERSPCLSLKTTCGSPRGLRAHCGATSVDARRGRTTWSRRRTESAADTGHGACALGGPRGRYRTADSLSVPRALCGEVRSFAEARYSNRSPQRSRSGAE